jgi:tRNA (guanosine-2'-O-)-methyltransferase
VQKSIKEQVQYLSAFVLERRWLQLNKMLDLRTRYITVCLENIYQSQNASAALRTCDAFGIQDVHVIEQSNVFVINPDVAMGTEKWLNLYKYNDLTAIDNLRKNGYRIVATTPRENSTALNDFDLSKGKTALFFGTELTGLSDGMMEQADEFLYIPMYGFVESFNISVSASIILHHLSTKLRCGYMAWQLTEEESDTILLRWLKSSVRSSELLLERFFEDNKGF